MVLMFVTRHFHLLFDPDSDICHRLLLVVVMILKRMRRRRNMTTTTMITMMMTMMIVSCLDLVVTLLEIFGLVDH